MGNFEIAFVFGGHHYIADVSVHHGKDHLQYTVSPQDEDLRDIYPAQVIHEFPSQPLQPAFPGTSEEGKAYMAALLAGLKKFLDRAHGR